jgi:hypothetical protein
MSIIQLLDAIWTRCHEQCVLRAEEARKWVIDKRKWTPWAEDLIIARDKATKKCRVIGNIQKLIDKVCYTLFFYTLLSNTHIITRKGESLGSRPKFKAQTSSNLVESSVYNLKTGIRTQIGKRCILLRFMIKLALVVYIRSISYPAAMH